jgi:hypothetical protein
MEENEQLTNTDELVTAPSEHVFEKVEKKEFRKPTGSRLLPVLLVLFGVYFLLKEYDLLNNEVIRNTVKLWPLILVYFGLDKLLEDKPKIRRLLLVILVSLAVFFILLQSEGNLSRY